MKKFYEIYKGSIRRALATLMIFAILFNQVPELLHADEPGSDQCAVTFVVQDEGGNTIAGAVISVDEVVVSGQTSQFSKGSSINYTVTAEGYREETGTYSVPNEDTATCTIQMERLTCDVSFVVKDGENVISDATVMVGETDVTNSTITRTRGETVSYTVSAANYVTKTDSFVIPEEATYTHEILMTRGTCNVSFEVKSGDETVQNATVKVGDDDVTNGASFGRGTTIYYTVTAPGYYNEAGSYDVPDRDTANVLINMTAKSDWGISISQNEISVSAGETSVDLSPYINIPDGQSGAVIIYSCDSTAASVNASGVVTKIASAPSVTVSATVQEDATHKMKALGAFTIVFRENQTVNLSYQDNGSTSSIADGATVYPNGKLTVTTNVFDSTADVSIEMVSGGDYVVRNGNELTFRTIENPAVSSVQIVFYVNARTSEQYVTCHQRFELELTRRDNPITPTVGAMYNLYVGQTEPIPVLGLHTGASAGFIVPAESEPYISISDGNIEAKASSNNSAVTFNVYEDISGEFEAGFTTPKDIKIFDAVPVTDLYTISGGETGVDGWYRKAEGSEGAILSPKGNYKIRQCSVRSTDENDYPEGNIVISSTPANGIVSINAFDTSRTTFTEVMDIVEKLDFDVPNVSVNTVDSKEYYNSDTVNLSYSASDDLSKLYLLSYSVSVSGSAIVSDENILFQGDTVSGNILTISTLNEQGDKLDGEYVVTIKATDKAGNVSEATKTFYVSRVKPQIEVIFDSANFSAVSLDKKNIYFSGDAKATIKIKCNSNVFDKNNLYNVVNNVENGLSSLDFSYDNGYQIAEMPFNMAVEKMRLLNLKFSDKCGNQVGSIKISYTDKDSVVHELEGISSITVYTDNTQPLGKIVVADNNEFDGFFMPILHRLLFKDDVPVSIVTYENDVLGEKPTAYYYISPEDCSLDALGSINNWTLYNGVFTINTNRQLIVYAKLVDKCGNTTYLRSDGIIVDYVKPEIEIKINDSTDTVNVKKTLPDGSISEYYTDDVVITISTSDLVPDGIDTTLYGEPTAGLESLQYLVNGVSGNGVDDGNISISGSDLNIAGDPVITCSTKVIPAEKDTNEGVEVVAKVKDKAGNENAASISFKIDTAKPTISVEHASSVSGNEIDGKVYTLYGEETKLNVEVADSYSGLYKEIEYTITDSDDNETSGTIVCMKEGTAINNGAKTATAEVTLPATITGNCELKITVTDMAGNTEEATLEYRMITSIPEITVSYSDTYQEDVNHFDGVSYFNTDSREAVITVSCDDYSFDEDEAGLAIKEALNYKSKKTAEAKTWKEDSSIAEIGSWSEPNGTNIHTVTVEFAKEGIYSWTPVYTDLVGHASVATTFTYLEDATKETVDKFVIDRHHPSGKVTVGDSSWERLVENITYENSSNKIQKISAESKDDISPLKVIKFYKWSSNKSTGMTKEQLKALPASSWKKKDELSFAKNDKFVLYVMLEDYAGNVDFISTNGIVFDTVAPEVSIALPGSSNGYYVSDFNAKIGAKDPDNNGFASGLASVTYSITSSGKQTDTGTFDVDNAAKAYEKVLAIAAEKNNTNDVVLSVTVKDKAGNEASTSQRFKVDVTAPAISVSYDNNDGDSSFADGVYFNKPRTATIRIQERNFSASNVKITIKDADGGNVPVIGGWSASGTGDDTVNTANVTYSADGKYSFDIQFSDDAGNVAGETAYSGLSPREFVIDTSSPVLTVNYDNNNSVNGNYYNDTRLATVTIDEHNFDASRVEFSSNATDNGSQVAAPTISGWSSSGDRHTATINFASDARYNWNINYTDKAGNAIAEAFTEEFYVDTTAPTVVIDGIGNESANGSEEAIGFTVTCRDTNFDSFKPVLTTVERDGNSFVTKEVEGVITNITNGAIFTVENLPDDGVYNFTCTAVDKAGNSFTTVQITDEEGNTTVSEVAELDQLLNFSVNREGSVFWIDDKASETVNNYYIQEVAKDLCVYETNTDELQSYSVEVNGETLTEGSDYTVDMEQDDSSWYLYTYRIKKAVFENEGQYNVVVKSTDRTDKTAYSDVKNLEVAFVVDKTAPVVTLSGITEDGRYQTDEQLVSAIPTDDGGKVQSMKVVVIKDNKEDVRFDMQGDDLDEYLAENNGTVKFSIPEGIGMTVRVICTDYAVDEQGKTNEYVMDYTNVTVSSNALVIFYANRRMFVTVVVGVIALIGGFIALMVFKKKKRK